MRRLMVSPGEYPMEMEWRQAGSASHFLERRARINASVHVFAASLDSPHKFLACRCLGRGYAAHLREHLIVRPNQNASQCEKLLFHFNSSAPTQRGQHGERAALELRDYRRGEGAI